MTYGHAPFQSLVRYHTKITPTIKVTDEMKRVRYVYNKSQILAHGLLLLLRLKSLDLEQRIELGLRLAVRSTPTIGESEVLSIVHSEVEMVKRMMRRPINDCF
jgi:hypothetical protein